MADQTPTSPPLGGPAGAAGAAQRGRMTIRAQYIKDLSFENPRAPDSYNAQTPPKIDVSVGVSGRTLGEDLHEVELAIAAKAQHDDAVDFMIELKYAGLFHITGLSPEQVRPVAMIECPRLLFPFARRVIADATRDGGFAPLMLDPIDFLQLYLRHQQSQAQTAKAGDGQAASKPAETA